MLVTDDRLVAGRDLLGLARRAVAGGVTCVQLRLKAAPPRAVLEQLRRLQQALPVPVLVNDRPDLARVAGTGVHLGADDLPLAAARALLPAGAIIGVSAGSPAEAAEAAGADYWGVGPWRETGTKPDAGAALGAAGFGRIVALAGTTPCVAIGSVRPDDVAAVLAAGGAGVAVVSGILAAPEPERAAAAYAEALARG